MSRIYFHSEHETAELRGSERAYMGNYCHAMLDVALGLADDFDAERQAERFRKFLPPSHYTQSQDARAFLRSFRTFMHVGHEPVGITDKVDPWVAALNTALVAGSDEVRLMARLHGQCEIHTFVEGKNRAWIASLIERGRETGLYRARQGWEDVAAMLRRRDDCPVVTSYSVCMQFPNGDVAGWADDVDGDGWYELPVTEQWTRAVVAIREKAEWLEMRPERWSSYYFDSGINGFALLDQALAADAVDPSVTDTGKPPTRV